MDYQTALKTIQGKKRKDSFLVIELGYSLHIILPYTEGIAFLTAMNSAESFEDSYSAVPNITYFDRSKLSAKIMSAEEYQQYKIAVLLNVPVSDVKEMEKSAA